MEECRQQFMGAYYVPASVLSICDFTSFSHSVVLGIMTPIHLPGNWGSQGGGLQVRSIQGDSQELSLLFFSVCGDWSEPPHRGPRLGAQHRHARGHAETQLDTFTQSSVSPQCSVALQAHTVPLRAHDNHQITN